MAGISDRGSIPLISIKKSRKHLFFKVFSSFLLLSGTNVFYYSIAENIILKYDAGNITGCPETAFASSIVGDKDGYAKVFVPGEDKAEWYAKKWYTEHEKRMIEKGYTFTC